MEMAAIVATLLLAVLALFQTALALGAPWGAASWGGRHEGVLPWAYRVASGMVAILFYPVVALALLNSAGIVGSDEPAVGSGGLWFLTVLFALSALANFISESSVERRWGPVAAVVAVCCGVVAATA